jgi:hypothetical protein
MAQARSISKGMPVSRAKTLVMPRGQEGYIRVWFLASQSNGDPGAAGIFVFPCKAVHGGRAILMGLEMILAGRKNNISGLIGRSPLPDDISRRPPCSTG